MAKASEEDESQESTRARNNYVKGEKKRNWILLGRRRRSKRKQSDATHDTWLCNKNDDDDEEEEEAIVKIHRLDCNWRHVRALRGDGGADGAQWCNVPSTLSVCCVFVCLFPCSTFLLSLESSGGRQLKRKFPFDGFPRDSREKGEKSLDKQTNTHTHETKRRRNLLRAPSARPPPSHT